jgi:pimeloyl-ACP methyl ester carboxylesterase
LVRVRGAELCLEDFGDPDDPAILLIMGAAASMLYWDADFCRLLARAGRYVIRYDHRDTGRSSNWPAGAPGYDLRDLVADAIGILDACELPAAHLAGMSMGASIVQLAALDHADRVATLTLFSSSPGGPGHDAPDLPPMFEGMTGSPPPEPDWTDRPAVVEHQLAGERAVTGTLPFDEARWRRLAEHTFDRTADPAASTNHFLLDAGAPWRQRLGTITAPALVLHGTEDPFIPYGHGVALAAEIPGAELIAVQGAGHEPPPRERWDVIVPAMVAHTARQATA